jgi:hypothetical protein
MIRLVLDLSQRLDKPIENVSLRYKTFHKVKTSHYLPEDQRTTDDHVLSAIEHPYPDGSILGPFLREVATPSLHRFPFQHRMMNPLTLVVGQPQFECGQRGDSAGQPDQTTTGNLFRQLRGSAQGMVDLPLYEGDRSGHFIGRWRIVR